MKTAFKLTLLFLVTIMINGCSDNQDLGGPNPRIILKIEDESGLDLTKKIIENYNNGRVDDKYPEYPSAKISHILKDGREKVEPLRLDFTDSEIILWADTVLLLDFTYYLYLFEEDTEAVIFTRLKEYGGKKWLYEDEIIYSKYYCPEITLIRHPDGTYSLKK